MWINGCVWKTEMCPLSQWGVMGSIPQSSEWHFQRHPLHRWRGASCEQKSTPPQSTDMPEIPPGLQPRWEWLTRQTVCSQISSVLYHQKSERSVFRKRGILVCHAFKSHPDFTGSSITDLTGTLGCGGGESLHCGKKPQKRLSMESQILRSPEFWYSKTQ